MPIYVYRKSGGKGCKTCTEGFEISQPMADAPLEKCPECGAPVERVITAPIVPKAESTRKKLSNENLKSHGFHKLVREDKGVYRKEV